MPHSALQGAGWKAELGMVMDPGKDVWKGTDWLLEMVIFISPNESH